jgi:hypothetical protein
VIVIGALLAVAPACSTVPVRAVPTSAGVAVPRFAVGEDTFAFANEVRRLHPAGRAPYANYCFVLARAVRQFHAFARFEPGLRRLDREEYAARVRRVIAHAPWEPALPADDRIVIPGYANLHEFSRDQEALVKEALGSPFWTWMHWTNWRITFPVSGASQERVAAEIAAELDAGRLVQLLVTNWPRPELNHTVVAYAYRATGAALELTVYDPNDPDSPGAITFDRTRRRFWATRLFDTRPGAIRAFRMYYSRVL